MHITFIYFELSSSLIVTNAVHELAAILKFHRLISCIPYCSVFIFFVYLDRYSYKPVYSCIPI